MPSVRKIHAPSTHGRIARAKARADIAGDQRADGEAERDRQPDIADVERRRMEGETGVLQQRVEPLPVGRRGTQPRERVGRRTAGRRKSQAQAPPARPASRSACARRAAFEQRDQRPRQRRGSSPTAASILRDCPSAGDLVDQRLGRMAVARDQLDRHVRPHEQRDQQAKATAVSTPLRDLAGGARRQIGCRRASPAMPATSRSSASAAAIHSSGKAEFGDHCRPPYHSSSRRRPGYRRYVRTLRARPWRSPG